jgi:ribosome-associated protein
LNNQRTVPAQSISNKEFNHLIIESIQDIKGKNIVKLDLRKLDESPADFFIICQGDSTTQVSSIASNVQKRIKEEFGILPSHVEGKTSQNWVLVDYFSTIVHVFYPETRSFYELEELWGDAEHTSYENL